MNYQALYDLIMATPACVEHAVTNSMPKQNAYLKDKAIADILNAEAGVRVVEDYCNEIEIMARLGPTTASTILDKLDAAAAVNSALRRAMRAIQSDRGIDLGHPQTRVMLDQFVPAMVLTEQESSLLKGLAERPSSLAYDALGEPVTQADVSIALRGNAQFTPQEA